MQTVIPALLLPFCGTAAGAACVFFLRSGMPPGVQAGLSGFAAGVMTAASVWSLLLPAIEQSADKGRLAFLPALLGLWIGVLFLLLLDPLLTRLERAAKDASTHRTGMMALAVTLHNIPEGMAVGVVCAGLLHGADGITGSSVLTLSLGIAVQNFPEGAIISMPLFAGGKRKLRAFLLGVLSGAVEPVAGALTLIAAGPVVPVMPYFLSFAAGAMLCVVVSSLIPSQNADGSYISVISFAVGFGLMMAPDVALG